VPEGMPSLTPEPEDRRAATAEGQAAVTGAADEPPPGQAGPDGIAAAKVAGTPRARGAAPVSPHPAREYPDPSKVNTAWWISAILLLAMAIVFTSLVAPGTAFGYQHRWFAALTALLDVIALTALAHVILLWYQSGITDGPASDPVQQTLDYRRRGLKAAVMGQDGRASTSKTQVALWTAAVVWALIDLLLLARSYPGGNLFTGAVTSNWRPEYLVLLGLPVGAATAAFAAVSASNGGKGPVPSTYPAAAPGPQAVRVYVRDPVLAYGSGFGRAVAELITADDGTVAWADLQYVVFTLITFVYFLIQVLSQPQNGLPPVPAALLTLMGVSAAGYTAKKVVDTRGTVPSG
jgi:hypothetical protein